MPYLVTGPDLHWAFLEYADASSAGEASLFGGARLEIESIDTRELQGRIGVPFGRESDSYVVAAYNSVHGKRGAT